ncbi:hypothetical protein EDC01DRAFT_663195, partial [Geopyxis carbonaria]
MANVQISQAEYLQTSPIRPVVEAPSVPPMPAQYEQHQSANQDPSWDSQTRFLQPKRRKSSKVPCAPRGPLTPSSLRPPPPPTQYKQHQPANEAPSWDPPPRFLPPGPPPPPRPPPGPPPPPPPTQYKQHQSANQYPGNFNYQSPNVVDVDCDSEAEGPKAHFGNRRIGDCAVPNLATVSNTSPGTWVLSSSDESSKEGSNNVTHSIPSLSIYLAPHEDKEVQSDTKSTNPQIGQQNSQEPGQGNIEKAIKNVIERKIQQDRKKKEDLEREKLQAWEEQENLRKAIAIEKAAEQKKREERQEMIEQGVVSALQKLGLTNSFSNQLPQPSKFFLPDYQRPKEQSHMEIKYEVHDAHDHSSGYFQSEYGHYHDGTSKYTRNQSGGSTQEPMPHAPTPIIREAPEYNTVEPDFQHSSRSSSVSPLASDESFFDESTTLCQSPTLDHAQTEQEQGISMGCTDHIFRAFWIQPTLLGPIKKTTQILPKRLGVKPVLDTRGLKYEETGPNFILHQTLSVDDLNVVIEDTCRRTSTVVSKLLICADSLNSMELSYTELPMNFIIHKKIQHEALKELVLHTNKHQSYTKLPKEKFNENLLRDFLENDKINFTESNHDFLVHQGLTSPSQRRRLAVMMRNTESRLQFLVTEFENISIMNYLRIVACELADVCVGPCEFLALPSYLNSDEIIHGQRCKMLAPNDQIQIFRIEDAYDLTEYTELLKGVERDRMGISGETGLAPRISQSSTHKRETTNGQNQKPSLELEKSKLILRPKKLNMTAKGKKKTQNKEKESALTLSSVNRLDKMPLVCVSPLQDSKERRRGTDSGARDQRSKTQDTHQVVSDQMVNPWPIYKDGRIPAQQTMYSSVGAWPLTPDSAATSSVPQTSMEVPISAESEAFAHTAQSAPPLTGPNINHGNGDAHTGSSSLEEGKNILVKSVPASLGLNAPRPLSILTGNLNELQQNSQEREESQVSLNWTPEICAGVGIDTAEELMLFTKAVEEEHRTLEASKFTTLESNLQRMEAKVNLLESENQKLYLSSENYREFLKQIKKHKLEAKAELRKVRFASLESEFSDDPDQSSTIDTSIYSEDSNPSIPLDSWIRHNEADNRRDIRDNRRHDVRDNRRHDVRNNRHDIQNNESDNRRDIRDNRRYDVRDNRHDVRNNRHDIRNNRRHDFRDKRRHDVRNNESDNRYDIRDSRAKRHDIRNHESENQYDIRDSQHDIRDNRHDVRNNRHDIRNNESDNRHDFWDNQQYYNHEYNTALRRPPGHHCSADLSGGYCYLNNTAVAVQTLLDLRGPDERVTVLHHGNGTQDM